MSLPFLSKKEQDPNKFIAATITSDFVRCIGFYYDESSYKIIAHAKRLLDQGRVRGGTIIDVETVSLALNQCIEEISEVHKTPINNMIFGVSGDLCTGLMTAVRVKRASPGPIEKHELESLSDKISEASTLQAQNEYMYITGKSDVDLEFITNSNVFTKIDGQPTKLSAVVGKTGHVLEVGEFNALVPTYHLSSLQELSKKGKFKIQAVGSVMYCLTKEILNHKPDLSDFVLVEIDGDYINAGVVFGKGLISTRTLPMGYKNLVGGINQKMGLTYNESARVLRSFVEGKLTSSESVVVQNAIKEPIEVIQTGLELLFAEFSGVKTFPPAIFLTGEGMKCDSLIQKITEIDWTKTIPFKERPTIKKFLFTDLHGISDMTANLSDTEWVAPASLSIIHMEMRGDK